MLSVLLLQAIIVLALYLLVSLVETSVTKVCSDKDLAESIIIDFCLSLLKETQIVFHKILNTTLPILYQVQQHLRRVRQIFPRLVKNMQISIHADLWLQIVSAFLIDVKRTCINLLCRVIIWRLELGLHSRGDSIFLDYLI